MAKQPDYNVFCPIERADGGGTYWHQIGAGWKNYNNGVKLELNSLPIPNRDGKVVVMIFDNVPKDEPQQKTQQAFPAFDTDLDDDVPF